jgi:hypothetical protein
LSAAGAIAKQDTAGSAFPNRKYVTSNAGFAGASTAASLTSAASVLEPLAEAMLMYQQQHTHQTDRIAQLETTLAQTEAALRAEKAARQRETQAAQEMETTLLKQIAELKGVFAAANYELQRLLVQRGQEMSPVALAFNSPGRAAPP